VDTAYLRAHPDQLPTFLKHQRIRETPVGGGSICRASRLTLDDGTSLFAKTVERPQPDFFETEAAGLRWLKAAEADGGVGIPEVIAVRPDMLVLEWIDTGPPSPAAAERFGRELAATHRAGADGFGAAWTGYIGSLPQSNEGSATSGEGSGEESADAGEGWPEWFAERRLRPHLRTSADRGALTPDDVALVERVLTDIDQYAPPPEPPARLHGDLWHGNVLWTTDDRVVLVDPSAHGGHRETDLAQLGHFRGAPLLDRIRAGYQDVWPLADGWRDRVPLHQLHLLLVHTALFGSAYRDSVMDAATATLRTRR
jgi:fructosamine-3-kinase